MSKNKFLALTILFGVISVASLVVLVILINTMIEKGATSLTIWGTVGFSVAFLVGCSLFGVNYTIYKYMKNPSILRAEIQKKQSEIEKQQNTEKELNINQID